MIFLLTQFIKDSEKIKILKYKKMMKIFIYKTIIVLISAIIVFKVTIGQTIKSYENKINSIKSKDNRENILNKIKDEIKSANNKDRIFSDEERILLSTFINKIRKEINLKDPK